MGKTSITCSQETLDTLRADKPTDVTWDEYLRVLHDDASIDIDAVEVVDAGEVRDAIGSVEERVGRVERTLEELGR